MNFPYNTVAFGAVKDAYFFGTVQELAVTNPASGGYFCAWKVKVPAVSAAGLPCERDGLLATDKRAYELGEKIGIASSTYGDVTMEPAYPKVTCGGENCPIRIATNSGFYERHLAGLDFAGVEAALEKPGANGYPLWEDYVLGIETNQRVISAIAVTNAAWAAVWPVARDGNSFAALLPRTDAGFDVWYSLAGTNEFGKATGEWPVVAGPKKETTEEERGFSVETSGAKRGFFRIRVDFSREEVANGH